MIVSFEDFYGNYIGSAQLSDCENDICVENIDGNISIADITLDDLYGTNDKKIRIQLDKKHRETYRFEIICTLKTLFFNINLNYLSIEDLNEFYQLNKDYGNILNLTLKDNMNVQLLYNEWSDIILKKYYEIKNDLEVI